MQGCREAHWTLSILVTPSCLSSPEISRGEKKSFITGKKGGQRDWKQSGGRRTLPKKRKIENGCEITPRTNFYLNVLTTLMLLDWQNMKYLLCGYFPSKALHLALTPGSSSDRTDLVTNVYPQTSSCVMTRQLLTVICPHSPGCLIQEKPNIYIINAL